MKLHHYTKLVAGATLVLIVAGGLVTSTGSGLAVPDWPLSYGMLFPPMVGGILYEHGHRMIAGTVAVLTAIMALWLKLREPRRWVRRLGGLALLAVILQAVLGGLTVIFLLPDAISIAHACLAQTFFCLVVTIALVTSPSWTAGGGALAFEDRGKPPLRTLAFATFAAIYVQLVIGALVRHMDAGLAIPDFPLAFGQIIPPLHAKTVAVHFAHRVWAMVVLALILWTAARTGRHHKADRSILRPSMILATLVLVQIALGAATIWSRRAVPVATAHVAVGATLLATALVLAIRVVRASAAARAHADVRISRAAPSRSAAVPSEARA
jgi:cytochrome c oxidase assembly protein subunit 15